MLRSIPEIFFETARKYAKKTALLYKKEEVYFPITYKELAEKVVNLSSSFRKLNVGNGDKIAILSENRPEWLISDLANMSIGAITVPLHTTLSSKAICNILNHSEAKTIIVSSMELLNKVLLIQNQLNFVERIISIEKISESQKETIDIDIFTWEKFLNHSKNNKFEQLYIDIDEPCTIIYTSGTTGEPKGVLLSHRNILSNVQSINESIPVKRNDIFLSFLPLSHTLERTAGQFIPILHGATVAYAESVKTLAQNLREVRPTIIISVPRIFEKFNDAIWDNLNKGPVWKKSIFEWALKQRDDGFRHILADFLAFKKVRKKLGGRLRLAISGGASLNEKLAKFFYKVGIVILEGYGLTETSPVVSVNQKDNFSFGSVGKVISEVKVKISEEKEILIKGPNVFLGYYKNLEGTGFCFDSDGWFHTGDQGFLDRKGFLSIIGRKKDMIVTSQGKNIWPEPIENLLNDDRFIGQSMVIGNGRKFISALIAPDWQEIELYLKEKGKTLQDREKLMEDKFVLSMFKERIEQKVNLHLNDYEKIKEFRLLAQEFSQEHDELTPTLKLRRHIIQKHYQNIIDSIYS